MSRMNVQSHRRQSFGFRLRGPRKTARPRNIREIRQIEIALEKIKKGTLEDLDSMDVSDLDIIGESILEQYRALLRRFRIKDSRELTEILDS